MQVAKNKLISRGYEPWITISIPRFAINSNNFKEAWGTKDILIERLETRGWNVHSKEFFLKESYRINPCHEPKKIQLVWTTAEMLKVVGKNYGVLYDAAAGMGLGPVPREAAFFLPEANPLYTIDQTYGIRFAIEPATDPYDKNGEPHVFGVRVSEEYTILEPRVFSLFRNRASAEAMWVFAI